MTKLTQIVAVFFISFCLLLISPLPVYAQNLIRPIPDDTNGSSNSTVSQSAFSQKNPVMTLTINLSLQRPQFSFGDILNNRIPQEVINGNASPNSQEKTSRVEAIQKILDGLEASYKQSLQNFPRPTISPYMSIPTLVAGVSEIAQNQKIADTGQESELTTRQEAIGGRKKHYTIALLGDSMIDTLGKDLDHLQTLLGQNYPDYKFTLLNYGQGSTDMESGLHRLTNYTSYLGENYPPLLSHKPDILIVESFAYNHWGGEKSDLDRQWLTLIKIIDTVRKNSPETRIVLAVTISPNAHTFGDGVLNWPTNLKWESALVTKAYLQNLINFAVSAKLPLADAYHPSMDSDGQGMQKYINQTDHIHPSEEGKQLFSQKIVEAIKENGLID